MSRRRVCVRSQSLPIAEQLEPGTEDAQRQGMETAQALQPERVSSTGCCPRVDPKPYDDARFEWHDELFVREHIVNLLYVFARIKAQ
jgi:hypothetical protein